MRLRFVTLCAVLSAVALLAVPGLAGAAPHHNRGLTINATPNPIQAGEPVLIYGQLKGSDIAGKTIVLYHHISDSHRPYTVVSRTTTDSFGFYRFVRADGVVNTDRSWYVRQAGDPKVHSRTVYEKVHALVSINLSATTVDTRHSIVVYGHVTPNHRRERVLLQAQVSGDDWRTIKVGRLGEDSNYAIRASWSTAGERDLRVVFSGDDQNLRGVSDVATVTVEQAQVTGLTINTTTPVIDFGQSATITGTVAPTTTSPPTTALVLCHRGLDQVKMVCDQATITGSDGSYRFTVAPVHNALYQVRTALAPKRHSAMLFIGVRDLITLSASSSTGSIGGTDTFSGTVTPDQPGKVVYLQRLGADGDWHTVQVTRVRSDGSYSLVHRFGGVPGTRRYRTRILGGESNLGKASAPVTVTVSLPATSSLPAAS